MSEASIGGGNPWMAGLLLLVLIVVVGGGIALWGPVVLGIVGIIGTALMLTALVVVSIS